MVQFASYLRRVLCKTRLIFPRINGPNDAFRKTLLHAAKVKSRKLTDHGKELVPPALISNLIVFYDTR